MISVLLLAGLHSIPEVISDEKENVRNNTEHVIQPLKEQISEFYDCWDGGCQVPEGNGTNNG